MKIVKNSRKLQNDIISSFEVIEASHMECEGIYINEFQDYYELIAKKEEKLDQFDLSSVLSEFINSEYFSKEKCFLFGKIRIYFDEREEYNNIFAKIKQVFLKHYN